MIVHKIGILDVSAEEVLHRAVPLCWQPLINRRGSEYLKKKQQITILIDQRKRGEHSTAMASWTGRMAPRIKAFIAFSCSGSIGSKKEAMGRGGENLCFVYLELPDSRAQETPNAGKIYITKWVVLKKGQLLHERFSPKKNHY